MAAKLRMLKLLQEIRGFAHIANRQPPPRSTGLMLAQLRSHVLQATLPRRRLSIRMDAENRSDMGDPVRIIHVKQASASSATLPAR